MVCIHIIIIIIFFSAWNIVERAESLDEYMHIVQSYFRSRQSEVWVFKLLLTTLCDVYGKYKKTAMANELALTLGSMVNGGAIVDSQALALINKIIIEGFRVSFFFKILSGNFSEDSDFSAVCKY